MSKKKKFNLKPLIFIIVLFFIGLSASLSETERYNSVNNEISVSDLIEHAQDEAEAKLEANRIALKEEFNRQYSEPSLYFEDFSEVEAQLDEQFNKTLMAYFGERFDVPFFIKTHNQYYLPVLKQVREGTLSVDEALKDMKGTIRVPSFDLFYWYPDEENSNFVEEADRQYREYIKNEGNEHFIFQFFEIHNLLLVDKIEELKQMDKPFAYLRSHGMEGYISCKADVNFAVATINPKKETLKVLEHKYNQKFVQVDYDYSLKEGIEAYFAPKTDPTFKFPADTTHDGYLALLAQKIMYEEIEKIIDEEGYSGKIAHITIPSCNNAGVYPDQKRYDMTRMRDNINFLNKGYIGNYDNNLILLLEKDEEINYKKLQKISSRINSIITVPIEGQEKAIYRSRLFIYFYQLPIDEQKIVIDLFNRDKLTENYFRGNTSLNDIYSNMYKNRAETEGFHYLDTRAKKFEYMLFVVGEPERIDQLTPGEFGRNYKNISAFKSWED